MLAAEPQDWDPSYRSYQQSQKQKAKSSFSIPVPSAAVLGGASLVLVCLVGYFAVPRHIGHTPPKKVSKTAGSGSKCGDGVCSFDENQRSCPRDCKGSCGDTFCDKLETCEGQSPIPPPKNAKTCKRDCGSCGPIAIPDCSATAGLDEAHNRSMFWGTYSPHLYFGMRTRADDPIVANLMWHHPAKPKDFRFAIKPQFKGSYSWAEHDGRTFGHQVIKDAGLGVNINTTFVKLKQDSKTGGEWSLRVEAEASPGSKSEELSLVLHLGVFGDSHFGLAERLQRKEGEPGGVLVQKGWSSGLGDFAFSIYSNKPLPEAATTRVYASKERFADLHRGDSFMSRALGSNGVMQEHADDGSNVALLQLSVPLPLSIDVAFATYVDSGVPSTADGARIMQGTMLQSGARLTDMINMRRQAFHKRFEKTFRLSNSKCDTSGDRKGVVCSPNGRYTDEAKQTGMAALSMIMGQMGLWRGTWHLTSPRVDSKTVIEMGPVQVFATASSRVGVPVQWQEGFSLLVMARWDGQLSREILLNWLNTMQEGGWMPQALVVGESGRSLVDKDSHVQRMLHATPPTLLLAMEALLDHGNAPHDFLRCVMPRLVEWLDYYRRTQRGLAPHTYAWQGREKGMCKETKRTIMLASPSGMGDYPRTKGTDVSDDAHVDLTSWVAVMMKILQKLEHASWGGEKERGRESVEGEWEHGLEMLTQHIDSVHWSEDAGTYQDRGRAHDKERGESHVEFANHEGYVSLMPMMMGLVQDDDRVESMIKPMTMNGQLFTGTGIPSLAHRRRDKVFEEEYGKADNSWRGKIYVPFNYLAVRALNKWYHSALAQKVYGMARSAIVGSVHSIYASTGTFWEAYNHGKGERGKQQAWSGLMLLIMAEMY